MGGRLGKGDGDPYLSYLEMMELAPGQEGAAGGRPAQGRGEREVGWVGGCDVVGR
jgi:hypothetical protein